MREIAFRAYDKEERKMVPVCGIVWHMGEIIDLSIGGVGHGVSYHNEIGRYELMQYTGLKDKNKVWIYDGDILRDTDGSGSLYTVIWEAGRYCTEGASTGDLGLSLSGFADEMEIIGNIYSNPELLKEFK